MMKMVKMVMRWDDDEDDDGGDDDDDDEMIGREYGESSPVDRQTVSVSQTTDKFGTGRWPPIF
jgi:hypothetical protein